VFELLSLSPFSLKPEQLVLGFEIRSLADGIGQAKNYHNHSYRFLEDYRALTALTGGAANEYVIFGRGGDESNKSIPGR
jgi:hypothetical protein